MSSWKPSYRFISRSTRGWPLGTVLCAEWNLVSISAGLKSFKMHFLLFHLGSPVLRNDFLPRGIQSPIFFRGRIYPFWNPALEREERRGNCMHSPLELEVLFRESKTVVHLRNSMNISSSSSPLLLFLVCSRFSNRTGTRERFFSLSLVLIDEFSNTFRRERPRNGGRREKTSAEDWLGTSVGSRIVRSILTRRDPRLITRTRIPSLTKLRGFFVASLTLLRFSARPPLSKSQT